MRKRRHRPVSPPEVATPPTVPSIRALDAAAVLVALLCAAMAWASRGNLNVDGASYLDLADRLRAGDMSGFVQGYWSPVYPAMLAMLLGVTGATGSAAISVAHFLNLLVALAAVAMLWRTARQRQAPVLGVLWLTSYLLASARTIRIDAVTPDLLLLTVVIGMGMELLRPAGWRGRQLGLWAAAAFLVKTSVWPWLLAGALVAMLVLRGSVVRRRELWRAVSVAAVAIALWAGAMSLEAGRPTLGDAGRLNACWYLWSCDGRTPDSHRGAHEEYHTWLLAAGATAKVATFPETAWTYAPWSDPGSWQRGVRTQARQRPSVLEFTMYVGTQLGLVVGLWMALLIGAVLAPAMLTTHSAPGLRDAIRTPAGMAMGLGVLGMLQFVAVHAEPRLIAPFAMMFAMGFLDWRLRGKLRALQWPTAVLALIVAVAIGAWHLVDQSMVSASSLARTMQLEGSHAPFAAPHRVAVVGSALPMVPDLYRARARVVVQVMEPDPATLATWAPEAQAALAGRLRQLGATGLWISRGRDAYRIVPLPPAAPP